PTYDLFTRLEFRRVLFRSEGLVSTVRSSESQTHQSLSPSPSQSRLSHDVGYQVSTSPFFGSGISSASGWSTGSSGDAAAPSSVHIGSASCRALSLYTARVL